jgi:enoyl-CoA hydratase
MPNPEVSVSQPSDGVSVVRIDRPKARNALTIDLRANLAVEFNRLSQDDSVRVVIITGGPKHFAAGADITEMSGIGAAEMLLRKTHLLWQAIGHCPKPVIAAVNGFALGGGCELAMHADIVIAGETAQFAQPEIRLGLMPGAGGTQRLTRAVGKFKAFKFLLTGERIDGIEAERIGLASEVVADDQVQGRALELARDIAAMPPIAAMQIKEVLLAGQDAPLETALMLERKAFQLLFDTQDKAEGLTAFLEKRAPVYRGR